MGAKWSTVATTTYADGSPSDDGSATEANRVKYATIMSDLTDPLDTAIDAIVANLDELFTEDTTAVSTNYTTVASDHATILEITGSKTITLLAASTAGAGYRVGVKADSSSTVTVARSGADTIDGATSVSVYPYELAWFTVNAAGDGYVASIGNANSIKSIYTNGTERLRIQSGGAVNMPGDTKIGGAVGDTPAGKLHVYVGNSGATANTNADDFVLESNAGNMGMSLLAPDASNSYIYFGSATDSVGAGIQWNYNSSEFRLGPNKASAVFRFDDGNGAEAMRLNGSGDLGIGTGATVSARLHVVDSVPEVARIECTDAGASEGPILTIYRNSASPADNDLIGAISLSGETDTGALVRYAGVLGVITDTTNATHSGQLRLQSTVNGTVASKISLDSACNIIVDTKIGGALGDTPSARLHATDGVADVAVFTSTLGRSTSAIGPILYLDRDDGGNGLSGDVAGAVRFRHPNSVGVMAILGQIRSALETATSGAEDGQLILQTTRGGSIGARVTVGSGAQVGSPTGGDKGAGTINAAGDVYKNNSAYTNPDYALEHYYRGEIVQFAANEGASEYTGLRSIEDLDAFMREHLYLPGVPRDEGAGIFRRADFVLEKLEEAMLYITQLNDRIKVLEAA